MAVTRQPIPSWWTDLVTVRHTRTGKMGMALRARTGAKVWLYEDGGEGRVYGERVDVKCEEWERVEEPEEDEEEDDDEDVDA